MNKVRITHVVLATAVLLGAAGSPALASPDDGKTVGRQALVDSIPSDVRQKMLAQQPLSTAAHDVRVAIEAGHPHGFAGMALEESAVVVWWKGAVPDAVKKAIDAARATVPVEVRSARHSQAELKRASATILESIKANPGGPFHAVATRADGSGLTVERTPDATTADASSLPEVDVPVRVVRGEPRKLTSRLSDTSPYWGGARLNNPSQCTSAFGVRVGGVSYLLTAGHCGKMGSPFWNGDWTRFIGSTSHERDDHDLLMIRPNAGTSAGSRIYDGGVGAGEIDKAVAGWQHVTPGEWLCTSGSFSGAICGHRASNNFTVAYCDFDAYRVWGCFNDLVDAFNGPRALQPGDSGGPVFSLAPDNKVWAKGVISAGRAGGFAFQDFATANGDFGITPIPG